MTRPPLHPDWLASFVAFAEHMSFTRAARALHISQPALFGQIKKLGEALSVALYRREGQSLALTDEGRLVLAHARDVLAQTEALGRALRGEADEAPVLCAGEGAYLYVIGDRLRRHIEHAGPVRALTRDATGTVEALLSGEAHVGVAALARAPAGLEAVRIAEVSQVVALPLDHPLAKKSRLSPASLDGQALVAPPRGRPHREAIERALARHGASATVNVEATGWPLTLHLVSLGAGIAVVNACCTMPEGVVARPLSGFDATTYLAMRRKSAPHTAARERLYRALTTP